MIIKDKIEKLKSWSKEAKIKIIEGDYQLHEISVVDYPSENDEDMDEFIELIQSISPKFLVLETIPFDKEMVDLFRVNIETDKEEELEKSLKNLENFDAEYLGFSFFIFTEGMVLRYNYYLDEADDYFSLNKIAIAISRKNSNYKILAREKANELGKILAENTDYAKLKSRSQREALAINLFEELLADINIQIYYGVNLIVSAAEFIYETEVKPRKEKELKLIIADYLKMGWTKVKIAAELGLTKDGLNRYI